MGASSAAASAAVAHAAAPAAAPLCRSACGSGNFAARLPPLPRRPAPLEVEVHAVAGMPPHLLLRGLSEEVLAPGPLQRLRRLASGVLPFSSSELSFEGWLDESGGLTPTAVSALRRSRSVSSDARPLSAAGAGGNAGGNPGA